MRATLVDAARAGDDGRAIAIRAAIAEECARAFGARSRARGGAEARCAGARRAVISVGRQRDDDDGAVVEVCVERARGWCAGAGERVVGRGVRASSVIARARGEGEDGCVELERRRRRFKRARFGSRHVASSGAPTRRGWYG